MCLFLKNQEAVFAAANWIVAYRKSSPASVGLLWRAEKSWWWVSRGEMYVRFRSLAFFLLSKPVE